MTIHRIPQLLSLPLCVALPIASCGKQEKQKPKPPPAGVVPAIPEWQS